MTTGRWLYFLCIREASHLRGLRLGREARSHIFVCHEVTRQKWRAAGCENFPSGKLFVAESKSFTKNLVPRKSGGTAKEKNATGILRISRRVQVPEH